MEDVQESDPIHVSFISGDGCQHCTDLSFLRGILDHLLPHILHKSHLFPGSRNSSSCSAVSLSR